MLKLYVVHLGDAKDNSIDLYYGERAIVVLAISPEQAIELAVAGISQDGHYDVIFRRDAKATPLDELVSPCVLLTLTGSD